MATNANGQAGLRAGDVAVFGPEQQFALLVMNWSVIIDHEPDSTFETPDGRSALVGLSTLILQRLAATSPKPGLEDG
jgi:hypothetical protein